VKAVMASVPESLLEWRKRTGADRYDEMWEGVLHMPPAPTIDHEDLQWALETYLRLRWAKARRARVARMNLSPPGGWPHDYRVPDLILWGIDKTKMNRRTHFEGPPDVVVEIRSSDDESYEKLRFYARLGIVEIWVIDCETKAPEIYLLRGGDYILRALDSEGWTKSDFAGIEMRATAQGKLSIRIAGDESTREDIPAD